MNSSKLRDFLYASVSLQVCHNLNKILFDQEKQKDSVVSGLFSFIDFSWTWRKSNRTAERAAFLYFFHSSRKQASKQQRFQRQQPSLKWSPVSCWLSCKMQLQLQAPMHGTSFGCSSGLCSCLLCLSQVQYYFVCMDPYYGPEVGNKHTMIRYFCFGPSPGTKYSKSQLNCKLHHTVL